MNKTQQKYLNEKLTSGQRGAVVEIIDTNKVFAEFYDATGELIEWNDELAFEVEINQFKLKPWDSYS